MMKIFLFGLILIVMDPIWCRERPKPWEKAKMERQKDLFWFKVEENATEACKNVDEANVTIVPGPPGDTCKADNERFCFCGKKRESRNTKLEIHLWNMPPKQTFFFQN